MNLYPLFADLHGRPVLVVGGGAVAERKTAALLAAGAKVTVGATTLTSRLIAWASAGLLRHKQGQFVEAWLEGQWLVVAATGVTAVNRSIADAATAHRLWINVVDDADLSTFHVPAVVDRSPLMVAVSSAGAAPALTWLVRANIEATLDHSLGALVGLAAQFRVQIKNRFKDLGERRRFYSWLWRGPVARLLRAQQVSASEAALEAALVTADSKNSGSVALVGAGPGAPELLTLAGLRQLQEADVILHDRLVSTEILALARRDAERIEVGKQAGGSKTTQVEIHALMERYARLGKRVVRLKGGDPFIFGRGGEELEFLRSKGIHYEVVPGITSAVACAAYAGIPLTHREHAHSVRFVTAHCRESLDILDWSALADETQTVVVYMGVAQLGLLRARLMSHGRSGSTPIALIENGSLPTQRVITGKLRELEALAWKHVLASPTTLIIGEVATFANSLGWFGAPVLTSSTDLTRAA